MSIVLREYQQVAIDNIVEKYVKGIRRVVFQLATGGGKTITFSALISRYLKSNPEKKVVVLVHREELLNQAKRTLLNEFGVSSESVTAGVRYINPAAQVYIAMVETAKNRLKKRHDFFGDVGMLIIDEAHIGNFTKVIPQFPDAFIIGFTATPISANKKHPMNEIYQDIVCGIDIPDLIQQKALCLNRTYTVKSVNRNFLSIKNGEFDSFRMGLEFGKDKHLNNCIDGYEKYSLRKKTLIFNCNVEHSKLVTEAFVERGYPARHLDGETESGKRLETLKWFANTPNAILNNIGVLTTGFDEPSIETVIVNRSTTSIPLWLQMTGRGSRHFHGKSIFTIIDMGGNAKALGDWSQERNWEYIFNNPGAPSSGNGEAPMKSCFECDSLISANAKVCMFCGAEQPKAIDEYDKLEIDFELLENSINVSQFITGAQMMGANDYAALHQIKAILIQKAKNQSSIMNNDRAYNLLSVYQGKVEEWCRQKKKDYNQWHKETTSIWFFDELERVFKWKLEKLSIVL